MAEAEIRTHVTQRELSEWRASVANRGRRRDFLAQTRTTGIDEVTPAADGSVYVSKPERPGVRRAATDVRDALVDRRLQAAQRLQTQAPEAWKHLIQNLRDTHPGLVSSMTDQEIYAAVVKRTSQDATKRAFTRLNRNAGTIG